MSSTVINIEQDYKTRILNLWTQYQNIPIFNEPGCDYRKSPILPKEICTEAILFVGINPSFPKKAKLDPKNKEIEFYSLDKNAKLIPYFEKFRDIAIYCNKSRWDHIDLFFMRETNQKVIEQMSYDNVDFLQKQLNITFEIIERSVPELIVVSNSFASEFFGKKKEKHSSFDKIWKGFNLNFKNDFDKSIGTYRISIGGRMTPIIFSGMLSGQRALDIGSYERLKWHIDKIINS